MAKVKGQKSGFSKFNKALFIVFIILLVATVLIVALSSPKVSVVEGGPTEFVDEPKIEEFVAGTYGGVEFKTVDDVVNYYVESYNYTKTLTQQCRYDGGEPKEMYKLLGDENIKIENLLVEGKSNGTINNLVPGILKGVFKGGVKSLSPGNSIEPQYDNQDGKYDRTVSHLTVDDVLACNVKEADGKIVIQIQPKAQILSMPGEDSQGRFFNTLGDISGVVNDIGIITFSEGGIDDNFVVNYAGGIGTITIDPATKEVVEADYVMNVHIDVTHANVAVLKNKNASLDIIYTNHFPATDEYLTRHSVEVVK